MSVITESSQPLHRELCSVDGRPVNMFHRGTLSDLAVLAQVFSERQFDIPSPYQEVAFAFHQRTLGAGKRPLFVDLGANIGAASRWFNEKWHPCCIIAVEPDPNNFAVLSENTKDLSADVYHAGIDWQDGSATLIDPGHGEYAYQTVAEGDGFPVRMVSLRTILRDCDKQPFYLKIDIEGAEKSLFSADTGPAARFPIVVMEPHDWMLPGKGTSVPFFRWHAAHDRELVFSGENVFSIDWKMLTA